VVTPLKHFAAEDLMLMNKAYIGLFKDQFRTAYGSNSMASAGGKARPLKLNAFLFLRVQMKLQICPIIDICKSQ